MSYGEYVSHVLGLLDWLGILTPIKYGLIFVLSLAGMSAFAGFLRGRGSG